MYSTRLRLRPCSHLPANKSYWTQHTDFSAVAFKLWQGTLTFFGSLKGISLNKMINAGRPSSLPTTTNLFLPCTRECLVSSGTHLQLMWSPKDLASAPCEGVHLQTLSQQLSQFRNGFLKVKSFIVSVLVDHVLLVFHCKLPSLNLLYCFK